MTAYLQPGDKIFLCAPAGPIGIEEDLKMVDELKAAYAAHGIEVSHVALGDLTLPVTVVAVIREPYKPSVPRRSDEKLKLVDRDPPWYDPQLPVPEATEPLRPHPGYQDHPRVP